MKPGITNTFRRILPKPLKRCLRLIHSYPRYKFRLLVNYAYDRKRFAKYSSADSHLSRQMHLQSWIMGDYHKIEKALALRSPRPGFGLAVIARLVKNLDRYVEDYGADEIFVTAINALKEYEKFNEKNGLENLKLLRKLDRYMLLGEYKQFDSGQGGTIQVSREDILKQSCIDLNDFFKSRHSIRHFSDKPVPEDLIENAVRMARFTPSVCNRQSWKVYAYSESQLLKKVVACQMGNKGFGEQIKTILVITSNTETFFSIGERNQCWIDGGMFSMSLIYALHSLGLGSICLNWSAEKEVDEELHRVASIPESEAVIMLIGIGFLPKTLRVAYSHRKSVDEVLVWNKRNSI